MADDRWKIFGAWFQAERERASVSQTKAAKKADLNVIHLSRVENGHSGIKRETLERIVGAINSLSPSYKIDLPEAMRRAGYSFENDADGFFRGIDKLSPEHQIFVKKTVKAMIDIYSAEDNPDTDYIDD